MLGANLPRVGSCPVPETPYEWIGFAKSDIMIHPNYFKYNSKNLNIDPAEKIPVLDSTGDLAVVKLKTPPATQPAAVNFNGRDVRERIRQQQTATVAGWGRARNSLPFTTGTDLQLQPWWGPCTMQKAEIPLVSQVTCTEVGYFECNCDEYICTSTPDLDPPYPFGEMVRSVAACPRATDARTQTIRRLRCFRNRCLRSVRATAGACYSTPTGNLSALMNLWTRWFTMVTNPSAASAVSALN